jgi:AraC family transcriptional regulator
VSDSVQDGQFSGALHTSREVASITLAEIMYRPGLVVPAHAHRSALCVLVMDGAMTEERGSRKIVCESGTLIFQPPDEPHAHEFLDTGGRCFVVQFGLPWMERMAALGVTESSAPVDLRRSRANWAVNQLYREFRSPDTAAQLGIEGFALALLGEIARSHARAERGARPSWLVRAVDMLHARFREDLSMAEIAAAVGVHPTHLARTFQQFYGFTMGEHLRRLRVEFARKELATTGRSLSEIALSAGFADQAHFSRVFKQLAGVTPGAFRNAATSR